MIAAAASSAQSVQTEATLRPSLSTSLSSYAWKAAKGLACSLQSIMSLSWRHGSDAILAITQRFQFHFLTDRDHEWHACACCRLSSCAVRPGELSDGGKKRLESNKCANEFICALGRVDRATYLDTRRRKDDLERVTTGRSKGGFIQRLHEQWIGFAPGPFSAVRLWRNPEDCGQKESI